MGMIDKKDFLFRFVPQAIRKKILMDEEALYSTTDQVTARKICDELSRFVPSTATVIDATACIGGLTYSLTHVFKRVIAIEIDETRFGYLETNMGLLGVKGLVLCVHGDALTVCSNLDAEAIIIDPPWGGPEYKNVASLNLKLGNVDIYDVCVMLYDKNPVVKFIAIKVPVNFDDELFCQKLGSTSKLVHKAKLRKMCILIVQRC